MLEIEVRYRKLKKMAFLPKMRPRNSKILTNNTSAMGEQSILAETLKIIFGNFNF